MRHNKYGRKFSRPASQRRALLKSLLVSLLDHDKIKTTEAKCKSLRPIVERMITLARNAGTEPADAQASRRLAFARLGQKQTVKRLFDTIAPRYQDRKGGYTRILKLGTRLGDAAKMAVIELV